MSKKTKSMIALLALVATTGASIPTYAATNVSPWAQKEVEAFLGKSYNGNYNYKFKITRQEFAEVLEKALVSCGVELYAPSINPFKDTTNASVIKLNNAGYLAGTSNGKFTPNGNLTREQLAVMICRAYQKLGVKMPKTRTYNPVDKAQVASYATSSVKSVYEAGIIIGEGNKFGPKTLVSREQAIVIASRTATTLTEALKQKETQAKEEANTAQQVQSTDLYTYNSQTKAITIKKSCTIDATVPNTPSSFTNVTVPAGVSVTFKGVNITTADVASNGKLSLVSSKVTTLNLVDASANIDSGSSVTTANLQGTCTLDGSGKADKVNISDSSKSNRVTLKSKVGTLTASEKANITVYNTTDKISLENQDITLLVDGSDVNNIEAKKARYDIDIKNSSVIANITLNDEGSLYIDKSSKVKKLTISSDAQDAEIDIDSKYDISITNNAKCKINNKSVTKDSKVKYESGKLTVNGSSSSSDDEKGLDAAYDYLTYKKILDDNDDEDKVTKDLYFPTDAKGCDITWSTDDEDIINKKGKVIRQSSDKKVKVTAKIKYDGDSKTKTFTFKVLAKEDDYRPGGGSGNNQTTTENSMKSALSSYSVPTSLSSEMTLATTIGGYTATYSIQGTGATVTYSNGIYKLTPVQTDKAQTVTLVITLTQGSVQVKDNRAITIPAKTSTDTPDQPTPDNPNPDKPNPDKPSSDQPAKETLTQTELNDLLSKYIKDNLPIMFNPGTTKTLPKTIENSKEIVNVEIASTDTNLMNVEITDTGIILKSGVVTSEQNVTLNITAKTSTLSATSSPSVQLKPMETITQERIENDMQTILDAYQTPAETHDDLTISKEIGSSYPTLGNYTVKVTPVNNFATVKDSGDTYTVKFDSTVSQNVQTGIKVQLSVLFDGKTVSKEKTYNITLTPSMTEEEWDKKLAKMVQTEAPNIVGELPISITKAGLKIKYMGTLQDKDMEIPYYISFNIPEKTDGADPDGTPNYETTDGKVSMKFTSADELTLTAKDETGEGYPLKVKVSVADGEKVFSVEIEKEFYLGQHDVVDYNKVNTYTQVFEILNQMDFIVTSPTNIDGLTMEVYDKDLNTKLGTQALIFVQATGKDYFNSKFTVKMSKSAVLGNYSWKLVKDGKVVKEGDYTNNYDQAPDGLSTTKVKTNEASKVDTTLLFL